MLTNTRRQKEALEAEMDVAREQQSDPRLILRSRSLTKTSVVRVNPLDRT